MLVAPPARAGDPCPIGVTIVDLGTPDWINRNDVLDRLSSQVSWIGISHVPAQNGIELDAVHPGSPAEAAGLLPGDILTEINGIPIEDSAARRALFDSVHPGDMLRISLMRDDRPLQLDLQVGRSDPVVMGLIQAMSRSECRDPGLRLADEAERDAVRAQLFTPERGFRCDDAHVALRAPAPNDIPADVYFIRGSRRVLLTMPGWATTCVQASELDGERLTDAALLSFVDRVIGGYVADRHANP